MSCVGKIIKTTNQVVSNNNEQLKAVAKKIFYTYYFVNQKTRS